MNRIVLVVLSLSLCAYAPADIRNGVLVSGASPNAPAPGAGVIIPPPAGATVINFDDLTAPCIFVDSTGPLTTRYSGLGVNFSGPAPGSGGAILNQCGNFSVTGQSAPNFLAFNPLAMLPGGGRPRGPETISFDVPVTLVQVNVGSADAGPITLECFAGSTSVGVSTATGEMALTTLLVNGAGITHCTLTFSGFALVADDLAFFAAPEEIPALTEWGLLALAVLIAAFGVFRLASRARLA